MRNIFEERINMLPYEYPEAEDYLDAITHSYWLHTEFNYTSDIQDFKSNVTEAEANTLKRALLVVSQMEMSVQTFWAEIVKVLPKPEIGLVGMTFAESEVRHARAYAHLVEKLGLQEEFEKVLKEEPVSDRLEYLEDIIKIDPNSSDEERAKKILTFGLFVEFVSLFSQFYTIMAFNKHRNLFKGVSNVVEATTKEEQIHGMFGVRLMEIIKEENPEWFQEGFRESLVEICASVMKSEEELAEWIFQDGDLGFVTKEEVLVFAKDRINKSLEMIGQEGMYEEESELLGKTKWFMDEILMTKEVDFFNKRSVNYSKKAKPITSDDLFD